MYLNGESIAKITINNISIAAGNLKPRRIICACQKLEKKQYPKYIMLLSNPQKTTNTLL